MNTPRTLVNAHQIKSLTGLEPSLLKYHRNEKHIRGYRLEGEREWLYRLDQINRLFIEHMKTNTRQNQPELAIMVTNSGNEEGSAN